MPTLTREKVSVRLDPDVVMLGRKLAKHDFGSDQKFGLLIEHAIRAYHARQVQPVEASSLLSATEQALIDRLEKRVEEMGRRTVERVANLVAKSSYETCLSSIMLEHLFARGNTNAKGQIETLRKEAAKRMKTRLDKEGAEDAAAAIEENQVLTNELSSLKKKAVDLDAAVKRLTSEREGMQQKVTASQQAVHQLQRRERSIAEWTQGLAKYLAENYSRIKSNSALIDEYKQKYGVPEGINV